MRKVVTVVLAFVAAAALWGPFSEPGVISIAHAGGIGGAIVDRLRASAATGDVEAREALDDLRRFLVQHGLDASVLDVPNPVDGRAAIGRLQLTAHGLAPFWIDVTPAADLDSESSLSAYVAERRAAAKVLSESGTRVSGRLAFADFVDVDRLLALRDALGLIVQDADVDVWLDGGWVGRAGYGPDAAEFWAQPGQDVQKALRSMIATAHTGEPLAMRISDVRLTVHGATIDVPDSAVDQLLAMRDILLFDPYTDLLASYATAAAHVRVVGPVDVFNAWVKSQTRAGEPYPFIPAAGLTTKGEER